MIQINFYVINSHSTDILYSFSNVSTDTSITNVFINVFHSLSKSPFICNSYVIFPRDCEIEKCMRRVNEGKKNIWKYLSNFFSTHFNNYPKIKCAPYTHLSVNGLQFPDMILQRPWPVLERLKQAIFPVEII